MKKIVLGVLALALAVSAAAALTGCGGKRGEVVNVYNWGEYIDTDLLKDFEKLTGIKVNYSTFQNNEDMYAAMKMGGASYDVIFPSDYMVSRLIEEDMLAKLDYSNIPNNALLDPAYKSREYDPTGEYSVAYLWGTVGIIYNTAMITDKITSWDALFDPAYSGQILMFDNPRDAFGIALKSLGYSLNTTDEVQLRDAYEMLAGQKPILQAYVMDKIFDKLEKGEAAIGPYYAGDYITMRENNPDLAFVLPQEGSNVFIDAMCIPKNTPNKTNAEKFINFMCTQDAAARNIEVTGYISPNAEAAAAYAAELDEEDYAVQFPSAQVLARCEPFINLPAETLALYAKLWVDLKT